jgi:tetratricopeptide (TPR) repeat protein
MAMAKRLIPSNRFMTRIKAKRLSRMKAKRQAESQARLAAAKIDDKKPPWWSRAAAGWTTLRALVLNVVGVVVLFGAGFLLYEAVMQPKIAVSPIITPKELADKGYTPEAAAEELRAALYRLLENAHSLKRGANIAAQTEIPNIIVPHTGLSIETIAEQIRKLLGVANRWNVSGGVTSQNDRYILRLRIASEKDSRWDVVSSDVKHIDDLFSSAARTVLEVSDPYLLALSYRAADPNKSLELARQMVNRDSEDAFWARVLIGVISREQHKFDDAAEEYNKALAFERKPTLFHAVFATLARVGANIDLDRKFAIPHNNLGLVLYDQGKTGEAIAEFQKAIGLDPKWPNPHNNLGLVLNDQGKRAEAIAEFEKAIDLDPKNAYPYNSLGLVLKDQGKTTEAIVEFEKAIDLDPKNAIPHNNLGVVLNDQGKTAEAIAEYEKAIGLDPKKAIHYINLGVALKDQGKDAEAVAAFEKAIDLDPENALAHNILGVAFKDQSKDAEAITAFEKAIGLGPRNVLPHLGIAIDLDPKDANPHMNLGLVLKDQGKAAEANAEFEKAIGLHPKNATPR